MSEIEKGVLKCHSVAVEFLESVIWQATFRDARNSSASSSLHKSNKNFGYLSLLDRILELFTRKEYKWQIEDSDNLVSYSESERRISLTLFMLSIIFLMTSSILAIVIECTFQEKAMFTSSNNYYIHEIGM